jgi:catechol 2,3-dioxygenase-like lactoylglutathione lyase family enzyme
MVHHHVHHVHLFASDIDRSVAFYRDQFGGEVVVDAELAGARNVFMRLGRGRLHFYDQPPRHSGRGSIHHFGIQTDDIEGTVERLRVAGVPFNKEITDLGVWRYIMVPAPDDVLIELFQVDLDAIPAELRSYFEPSCPPEQSHGS